MAARTAMQWIIRELRRKVYDVGPEDLDDSVQYAGDTIRLKCVYYDLASTAVNPTTPRVSIWDSAGTLQVDVATTTATATTGVQIYDYTSPQAGPEGTWRAQFHGIADTVTSLYTKEFALRVTQRIWSDDLLQNYLDRWRAFVGGEIRELLRHNAGYTRYWSEFDNFEWATLYTGTSDGSSTATPDDSNLVAGEFTFDTAQSKDLYLEGHSHNILMGCVEALEELAGDPSRSYQWVRGGVSHRSISPLELAKHYRAMAQGVQSVSFSRAY